MSDETSVQPWYQAGLRFTCTGCGACCTGTGRVWLNEDEIINMAQALHTPVEDFVTDHIERVEGRWALSENPQSGACIFLSHGRCQVYHARPRQCRTFPWWPSTLQDANHWAEAKRICEGVDHPQAPLVPLSEIRSQLEAERKGRLERSKR